MDETKTVMSINTTCVGCQYRKDIAKKVMEADVCDGSDLDLVEEPDNKYNNRAIAVKYYGDVLGYIPNDDLDAVHAFLDNARLYGRVDITIGNVCAELDFADGKMFVKWFEIRLDIDGSECE